MSVSVPSPSVLTAGALLRHPLCLGDPLLYCTHWSYRPLAAACHAASAPPLACAAQGIHKAVLREFLNPRHWAPSANREFFFSYEQVRSAASTSWWALGTVHNSPPEMKAQFKWKRGRDAGTHRPIFAASQSPCRLSRRLGL